MSYKSPTKARSKLSSSTKPQKSHYNVTKLLLIGLAFHLIYINSVFDCYFTSPVVHGMQSYGMKRENEAPAKRLVLIVGDGLRADLLFSLNAFPDISDSPEVVAPHLRSIVETRGAFGISHTRVPTESRPGHVAIIGGMYEDVSAVTKGWKTNPVDFDSVFNRSRSTYSFGSPDILPMFAKGASPPGKVKTWMYDEDEEDFTKDATALDIWVLDHLKQLFKNATTDPILDADLRSDKVVFFLHLLGLDTTGHAYRPHSKEYMHNIQVVDNIVQETEKLFSSFYGEDESNTQTAFVFTADHGMSVIGNHGDGHPDNTRTPLVAWGSGVREPLAENSSAPSHDSYSAPWNLTHLLRSDVEQADIAALMAALLGVGWPVNGVGVLPDVKTARGGYLDWEQIEGEKGVADLGLVNAKVILEQYRVKDELKRKNTLFYKPFKPLAFSNLDTNSTTYDIDNSPQIQHITSLISSQSYTAARQASFDLIQLALQGLHYLQTYDRFLIRGLVTFAYLGWAAWVSLYLFRPLDTLSDVSSQPAMPTTTRFIRWTSWAVLAGFWILFAVQRSPWSFYVYVLFPIYFWREVLLQCSVAPALKAQGVKSRPGMPIWRILGMGLMVVGALLGMVAGYTHRSIWSIRFVIIGLLWPLSWPKDVRYMHPWRLLAWAVACLVTWVFPLLPVDKTESLGMIMLGGLCTLLAGSVAAWYALQDVKDEQRRKTLIRLFSFQALAICATMLVTASSVRHLQAKQGLPLVNQMAGWVVLVVSSVLPFAFKTEACMHTKYTKILMYFLGFGPCFVILSISVEGLFFLSYSAVLVAWVQVEKALRSNKSSPSSKYANPGSSVSSEPSSSGSTAYQLMETETKFKSELEHAVEHKFELDDLRIALFFLFFVQVGFFGTGNVASISSFYLAPVYRLIPIFNPFYMSALLIFKIIAPYIMLSVTFAVLNDALNFPPFSLLLVALSMTDGMTLTFFYKVQDTGSWLEIGQSISFFCITSLLLLWAAGICAAGEWLMIDVLSAGKVQYGKEKGKKVD